MNSESIWAAGKGRISSSTSRLGVTFLTWLPIICTAMLTCAPCVALDGVCAESPRGDLYALVVGVSKYANAQVPQLRCAAKDAQDFANFLGTQKDLYNKIHVKLLTDEKATRGEVEKFLLYDMRKVGKNDRMILFFSGHGAIDAQRGGEYFFLVHDTDPEYLGVSAVLLSGGRIFRGVEAEQVLVISDMCHAGSFSPLQTKSHQGSMASFMQEFQASEGRVMIASSKPAEYSLEMPDMDNGVFTHFLLEGVRGPADHNRDGLITVQELYDYVYARTKDRTQGAQHPLLEGRVVGSFPVAVRQREGTLEILTEPPLVEVYFREESGFKRVADTDNAGRAIFPDLPLGKPVVVMLKKPGWKDRILDPIVFTRDRPEHRPELIKMEARRAFLLVKTDQAGARVDIGGVHAGTTGKDNLFIAENIQVGIPVEVALNKEGFKDRKTVITIPEHFEGKVFQTETFPLESIARVVPDTPEPVAETDRTKARGKKEPKKELKKEEKVDVAAPPVTPPEPDPIAVIAALRNRLNNAAQAGDVAEVRKVLAENTDPNLEDERKWTALTFAASSGHVDVARLLLEKGANVNARDSLGWTPLMVAASNGQEGMVKLLLDKKADKSIRNMYGESPATRATLGGHTKVLVLLGERVSAAGTSETAAANDRRKTDPKKESKQEGKDTASASPESTSEVSSSLAALRTKLLKAAQEGDASETQKLLAERADPNLADERQWTALMYAASFGHLDVAKLLLEKGAKVNAKDALGWTPLMLAASNGHEEMVKLLLVKKADKKVRNVYGDTAATRATQGGHSKILVLLGEKVPTPAKQQQPRESAARMKQEEPKPPSESVREDSGSTRTYDPNAGGIGPTRDPTRDSIIHR